MKSVILSPNDCNRSFGITINESTCCSKSCRPSSARADLSSPSHSKGFVTTPTVNISISFAILAITGLAPVPVPPPKPAVINNIFVSDRSALIDSPASSADALPISGFIPAPRPFEVSTPSWIFSSAGEDDKSWVSVLAHINFTP